jgi:hypothetical protein
MKYFNIMFSYSTALTRIEIKINIKNIIVLMTTPHFYAT